MIRSGDDSQSQGSMDDGKIFIETFVIQAGAGRERAGSHTDGAFFRGKEEEFLIYRSHQNIDGNRN